MATIGRGYTFGATELVTNTKLHSLVDSATISGISNTDLSAITSASMVNGSALFQLGNIPSAAGSIPNANIAMLTMPSMVFGGAFYGLDSIPSAAGVIPAANLSSGIPTGVIVMWSGAISAIPAGWYLCNGANSTPDLRGRFVIAAQADSGETYDVGDTGNGTIPEHSHAAGTLTGGAHTHTVNTNSNVSGGEKIGAAANNGGEDTKTTSSDGAVAVTGSTGNFGTGSTNVAVYYALAYIMKG